MVLNAVLFCCILVTHFGKGHVRLQILSEELATGFQIRVANIRVQIARCLHFHRGFNLRHIYTKISVDFLLAFCGYFDTLVQ